MMRFCNEHLNRRVLSYVLLASLVIFLQCKEEPQVPKEYIARVGDDYLTQKDLNEYIGLADFNQLQTKEFVRNWIRQQVLLNSAIENSVNEDDEFLKLRESASKQLLIDLFIRHMLKNNNEDIKDTQLIEFYNSNKDKFVLDSDLYILNVAYFKTKTAALKFLNSSGKTFEDKWNSTGETLNNSSVLKNLRYFEYDFPTQQFYEAVKYLNQNEYSRIINSEQNEFIVVQFVNKLAKGKIGDFDSVRDFVAEAYLANMKQVYLDKLVDKLYDNFEIEIKKDLSDYEN